MSRNTAYKIPPGYRLGGIGLPIPIPPTPYRGVGRYWVPGVGNTARVVGVTAAKARIGTTAGRKCA
jgi:hypothetical protein